MLYYLYELNHAAVSPARAMADAGRLYFKNPLNPLAHTALGKNMAAAFEVFERVTRRYGKPEFGIGEISVNGEPVLVDERVVWERPFCRLLHFSKELRRGQTPGPRVLLVAPMSGHYATLLRGTVEAFLPEHDVYITDWADARMVPLSEGSFDLDDYIDYVISMLHVLGPGANIVAVCQPSVPVLAAVSVMSERGDSYLPATMTLMGGPIDTRVNPTAVNQLAEERGTEWFRRNVIVKVPFPHPGFMRDVYPGFLQLGGFMSMNLDRHMNAHYDLFQHLVEGDGDSAERHREFYDEYLAVMDLTAEFYLQTVETVFVRHALPKGEMMHRSEPVDPAKISKVALMTVEGEFDDISGVGQTQAAHALCSGIPKAKKVHYLQPGVGHYGVFNGSRFRSQILPRIADFIRSGALDGAERRGNGHDTVQAAAMPDAAAMGSAILDVSVPKKAMNGSASKSADDLTEISGIGPAIAKKLAGLGITRFKQIAELSPETVARIDSELNFKGRVARDGWIKQARKLAGG